MTRYAIGDIHGGPKTFRTLLDRISLKRGVRGHQPGDFIDRGPGNVLFRRMYIIQETFRRPS